MREPRKHYKPPALIPLGRLSELTQGNSGHAIEGLPDQAAASPRP
ncbi:MAG: lasso RiPP family leader peptide-containing protein [Deltaproteobacteria bacterium]|nr:lasso RiPP family leader peptide-containing protein [Deltaproteobacteria bacterium]